MNPTWLLLIVPLSALLGAGAMVYFASRWVDEDDRLDQVDDLLRQLLGPDAEVIIGMVHGTKSKQDEQRRKPP